MVRMQSKKEIKCVLNIFKNLDHRKESIVLSNVTHLMSLLSFSVISITDLIQPMKLSYTRLMMLSQKKNLISSLINLNKDTTLNIKKETDHGYQLIKCQIKNNLNMSTKRAKHQVIAIVSCLKTIVVPKFKLKTTQPCMMYLVLITDLSLSHSKSLSPDTSTST